MGTYASQLALSAVVLAAGPSGASSHGGAFAGGGRQERAELKAAKTAAPWAKVSTFPQTTAGLGEVSCVSSTCVAVGTVSGMSLAGEPRRWEVLIKPCGALRRDDVGVRVLLSGLSIWRKRRTLA